MANPDQLLLSLVALPKECEWVEFKLNNDAPDEVGELISALANSAALHDQEAGFLVWGVDDARRVVGTSARPGLKKIGNEELENWLGHLTSPRVEFRFHEWAHDGKPMVLLRVSPATGYPVSFRGVE